MIRVLALAMVVPFLFILFIRAVPRLGKLWMKALTWDPFANKDNNDKDEKEVEDGQDNGPI